MKHFSIIISLISLMGYSLVFSVNDHKMVSPNKALYGYYFMMKESINAYFLFTWFVDHKKVKQAKIECCVCKYQVSSESFYTYLAVHVKPVLIKKLMRIVTLESVEQIVEFLLNMHEKYKIICPCCQKYVGWCALSENGALV